MQSDGSDAEGVPAWMAKTLLVCDRLQAWASRPTSSALIDLTQSHIARLVAQVRSLSEIIGLEASALHDLRDDRSRRYSNVVQKVSQLINEAIDLLSFCKSYEQDGEDGGALNAVYARLHLTENNVKTDSSASSWSRNARGFRIHRQVSQFVSEWLGSGAASNSHQVGLGSDAPGIEHSATERLRLLLLYVSGNVVKQLSPRYIHLYASANEVPYRVDTSATPCPGSYGIVRKVVHDQWEEPLAEKTFQNVFSTAERKKILREVGVLEVCLHPNITAFVEAYEVRDQPHSIHLVMAPWAPYTLLQFLRSSDVSRATKCPWFQPGSTKSDLCICRMMYQIADAVRYLHGLSIKHKDIKPDNILLHHEGTTRITPLIADVGVSKVYRPGAPTDYLKSSYQYLAPEQLKSQESSLKADIWQLGCCFAMLFSVAVGGATALSRLWNSFENTNEDCSCNIAQEHGPFMETFNGICLSKTSSPHQRKLYVIVTQMLDLDSSRRIEVGEVMIGLGDLVGGCMSEGM